MTVPAIARAWFDAVKAPQKEFVLLPGVGHDPNPAMVEAQYRILTSRIAPLFKRGKD